MPPVRPTFSMDPGTSLCARKFRDALPAPHLSSFHRVEHEHSDGQRAYSARDGGDRSGNFGDLGMHVADQRGSFLPKALFPPHISGEELLEFCGISDGVHADVEDSCARLHVVTGDHTGASDGGNEDIGSAADSGQVTSLRMADGDGGVRIDQEHGCRFANDVATANDDRFLSSNRNVATLQNFDDTGRRTRYKSGTLRREIADVHRMEAIHVLRGVDRQQNPLGIHLGRKWKLDKDAINVVAMVELAYEPEEFVGAGRFRRGDLLTEDTNLFRGFHFAADVDFGGWIVSDENHGEAGTNAGNCHRSDFRGNFGADLLRDSGSVEDEC